MLTIIINSTDSRRIKEFVYAMYVATYLHTEPTVALKKG